MYKDLLPIGSIIRIKGGEKNLMICGRIMTRTGSDEIYDYVGCLYPEGIVDPDPVWHLPGRESLRPYADVLFQIYEEEIR